MSTATVEGDIDISPSTLLGLPVELRSQIFDSIFESTTIYVEPAEHDENYNFALSSPPKLTEKLNLVCHTFNNEIGDSWHKKVTYYFPNTVAFIDVLSQWPEEKIKQMRHAYIAAYPLPIYHHNATFVYTTHFMSDALSMFPGLQLDTLTVENIWLEPNGDPLDGWCLGATTIDIKCLLESKGWKEFRYLSGVLPLIPSEIRKLDERITKMKAERNEPGFEYRITRYRPQLAGLQTVHPDGTVEEQDERNDRDEVEQWYKTHPEEPTQGQSLPEDTEKEVMVWAKRGTADYVQDGENIDPAIKELLDHKSWVQHRRDGGMLVDDGMDDPSAHL